MTGTITGGIILTVATIFLFATGCGTLPPAPGSIPCTTDLECEQLYGYDLYGYDDNGTCVACEMETEQ